MYRTVGILAAITLLAAGYVVSLLAQIRRAR